ncbi:diacylglycerol/lipid kinase family protein [Microbacterium sp. NPDC078428]|uniref:diacylglycerol/lipid kinase family protein n=1 Tax=Microbacterium sp. NPDC078428 TaxID=3364190 RepID=UPI0037C5BE7F
MSIDLPTSPDGAGVLLLTNRSAGTAVVRADPLPGIRERLPAARIHALTGDDTPGGVLAAALAGAEPPRVLGVLGGDGSVASTAQAARDAGLPLLVLPGGTFNHFARALGIDTPDAALDAFVAGRGVRVGVAVLDAGEGEMTVLNTGALGIYPDFVAQRDRLRGRLGKWVAGVVAAVRVLRRADPLEVEIDGRRMRVWSVFVGVGRNSPERIATMQRWLVDDDVLDVRIVHARGPRVRAMASLAFGRRTVSVLRALRLMPRATDIERILTPRIEIALRAGAARGIPPFVHDGEVETVATARTGGEGPRLSVRVEMLPGSLEVYR